MRCAPAPVAPWRANRSTRSPWSVPCATPPPSARSPPRRRHRGGWWSSPALPEAPAPPRSRWRWRASPSRPWRLLDLDLAGGDVARRLGVAVDPADAGLAGAGRWASRLGAARGRRAVGRIVAAPRRPDLAWLVRDGVCADLARAARAESRDGDRRHRPRRRAADRAAGRGDPGGGGGAPGRRPPGRGGRPRRLRGRPRRQRRAGADLPVRRPPARRGDRAPRDGGARPPHRRPPAVRHRRARATPRPRRCAALLAVEAA